MRLNRNIVEKTIDEKQFKITIIPIGALIKWDHIAQQGNTLNKLLEKLVKDADNGSVNPAEYEQMINLATQDIESQMEEILSLILDHEDNDTTYDKTWWVSHMSEAKGLIVECVTKDEISSTKKGGTLEWDMLFSVMNKYWRAITWKEFFNMDMLEIKNITKLLPKEAIDLCFKEDNNSIKVSHVRYK